MRCSAYNRLWLEILPWSAAAAYYWLVREVGTFARQLKALMLQNRAVKLSAQAKSCRGPTLSEPTRFDQATMFKHFLPQWKAHCSDDEMKGVMVKWAKGYLDKEMTRRAKEQDPELKATDFDFIPRVTGVTLHKLGEPGHTH